VVGDTLYGAPKKIVALPLSTTRKAAREVLELNRNFLHSAELEFTHPTTGKNVQLLSPLPRELEEFLAKLRDPVSELLSEPNSEEDAGN
jgi:23S rRNA pseudouridine1911/1915/1917 synthase